MHTGFVVMLPANYLMNYFKHKRWAETGVAPIETSEVKRKAYWIEVLAKIAIFATVNFCLKKAPILIYGTSNIEPYPGFVKAFVTMFMLALIGGPFTQMVRTRLATPADAPTLKKTD